MDKLVNNLQNYFLQLSKYYPYICIMENTKYQYITLKVETKEENTEAKKLLLLGWVPLINEKGFITFFNISQ